MKKFESFAAILLLVAFVALLVALDEPSAAYAQGGKTATPRPRPTGITITPAPATPTATRAAVPVVPIAPESSRPGSQTIPGIGQVPSIGNINPGQIQGGIETLTGLLGGLGLGNLGALAEAIANPERFVTKVVINIRTAWFPYEFWAGLALGVAALLLGVKPPAEFKSRWLIVGAVTPIGTVGFLVGYLVLMFGPRLINRRF